MDEAARTIATPPLAARRVTLANVTFDVDPTSTIAAAGLALCGEVEWLGDEDVVSGHGDDGNGSNEEA